ncbi:MAG: protein-L-isoaspartate(D-aspartate) O-methyltransferase [Solirubrobacteraceae bacterium]
MVGTDPTAAGLVQVGRALLDALRGEIHDERVLAALEVVSRDAFVPAYHRAQAWENTSLPIDAGQTISQPLVVARMCQLLRLTGSERVLDVGTGSGYHAAVLGRLAAHVFTVEVREALSRAARDALAATRADNVTCVVADGARGLPDRAPFDAINVAAAAPETRLAVLVGQLAPGGRLVAPVSEAGGDQRLVVLARRASGEIERTEHESVRFVPLVES